MENPLDESIPEDTSEKMISIRSSAKTSSPSKRYSSTVTSNDVEIIGDEKNEGKKKTEQNWKKVASIAMKKTTGIHNCIPDGVQSSDSPTNAMVTTKLLLKRYEAAPPKRLSVEDKIKNVITAAQYDLERYKREEAGLQKSS